MSVRKTLFLLSLVVLELLLFGCATPAPVKHAELRQARDIPTGTKAKPLQFKKIVVKLPRGTVIGQTQIGALCLPGRDIVWNGGRADITGDEFTDAFRGELEKANYTVVGNPDALFSDESEWKAELLIAGLINEIQANVCFPNIGFGNTSIVKGGVYLKVNWQIYSRLDRKVVYEITTEGTTQKDESVSTGILGLYLDAFAAATQNLLADQGFYNLVTGNGKSDKLAAYPRLSIKTIKPYIRRINDHITDVRSGVVTVFAGDGHGSGFFISQDGYLLTDHHVVGGAKFVKVKLASGRELLGEVVRANSRRDIALIKVEEGNMDPLPIRTTAINVGSDVYALGSPLDQKFSTTVSKGVISGYRDEDNIRYIQSDVNILPGNSGGPLTDNKGNVVGVSVSGIFLSGAPSRINFFIPIDSALKELKLELQ